MKKRKKSRKKTLLIVLGILALFFALIASAGYFAVDKAFSVLTGSLYQSSSVQEETSLEENKSAEELPQNEEEIPEGQMEEGKTSTGQNAQTKDALSAAQEKHGISGSMKFSAEQVQKLEKSVSLGDKLAVMAIISRSLSASDYQTLLAMTSGGITREEVGKAYSILSRSLSGEDKSKIYGYYSKYAYLLEN